MQRIDTLNELLALTRTGEFEDNGRIRVVSAHWSADRFAVRLEVDDGNEQHTSWQLRFRRLLEYHLSDVFNCGLNVWRTDHPVLAQYTDSREYLHFSSAARNPNEAVGELWIAHRELVDDWIPFDRFLNETIKLPGLLAGSGGLVATGPSFLISAYANVLDAQGCQTMRQALPSPKKMGEIVMAHFGESYVVAEAIMAVRLTEAKRRQRK